MKFASEALLKQLEAFYEEFREDGIDQVCYLPERRIETGGYGMKCSSTRGERIVILFDNETNGENETVERVALKGGKASVTLREHPDIEKVASFYSRLKKIGLMGEESVDEASIH